ncbi:MAG: tRNA preQ1(34) S-adenosylmethionine ribosyltransferase-isomerase QueA [Pseudomonadota bacterium]
MKLSDFYFDLPEELIAKYPANKRTDSRLLALGVKNQQIEHLQFTDLIHKINKDDLLVFNDTKVIPARFHCKKHTGGKVEFLFERMLENNTCLAHMKSNRKPNIGDTLTSFNAQTIEISDKKGALWELTLKDTKDNWIDFLKKEGHIPLPPYMQRDDNDADEERYQTVYAKREGAVAAPTAGLHFDEDYFTQLTQKGCEIGFVTLHVGAGTFQPIRTDNVSDHEMHSEYYEMPEKLCEQISRCKSAGGRVIAIGTTSVRCLESAAIEKGVCKPQKGETDIYIYPGYKFKVVDALFTNFHLPESTLMLLVSALASRELILEAYQQAIEHRYRFYSYGDAMFIDPLG